jgi:hypothetical protein
LDIPFRNKATILIALIILLLEISAELPPPSAAGVLKSACIFSSAAPLLNGDVPDSRGLLPQADRPRREDMQDLEQRDNRISFWFYAF